MKVIIDGKEIELEEQLKPGELELDKLTPEETIDMEPTLELSDELLEKIQEMDIEAYE